MAELTGIVTGLLMWGKHLLPQLKHTLPMPAAAPEVYVTGTALVLSEEAAVSALSKLLT